MERKTKRNRFPKKGKLGWFSSLKGGSDENKGNPAVNATKFNDAMATNGSAPTSGAMGEAVRRMREADEVEDTEQEATQDQGKESSEVSAELEQEFEKVLDDLKKKDYESYVKTLEAYSKDKDKIDLFKKCFGKVDTRDVKITRVAIPVKNLFPTQSEIDLTKSLSWPFLGGDIAKNPGLSKENPNKDSIKKCFAQTLGQPEKMTPGGGYILTYNGKYIIDGHHRWSLSYCVNPTGAIDAINFQYSEPPKDKEGAYVGVLKDFQAAIFTENGTIKVATADPKYNVFTMSDNSFVEFIKKYMSNYCAQQLSQYPQGKQAGVLTKDNKVSTAKAGRYFYDNLISLKTKHKPEGEAPNRGLMPQTGDIQPTQDVIPPTAMTEELDDDISELIQYVKR